MASVLVVDDEPDIRELVGLNLRLDGHHVSMAGDGRQALDEAAARRPDLIVLDVMMPVLDGFGVLAELRRSGSGLAGVPVVMLTARTDRLDRIRGSVEGAVVYLTKPFSVAELRARVAAVLGGGEGVADMRRAAASDALADLARLEAGTATPAGAARPRLTRFEPHGPRPLRPARMPGGLDRTLLSPRQAALLDAVAASTSIAAVARELGVSRSYMYASLGRIAAAVGVGSGPEVIRLARRAAAP